MHFLSHIYAKNLRSIVEGRIQPWPKEIEQFVSLYKQNGLGETIDITEALEIIGNFVTIEHQDELIQAFHSSHTENAPLYSIRHVPKTRSRTRYHTKSTMKSSIKSRRLEEPIAVLLAAQRKILRWLEGIYQPPKSVFGFVKKRNHILNARCHAENKPKIVCSIDVENFFGTTTSVQLYPKLWKLFRQIDLKGHSTEKVVESVLLLCTTHRLWQSRVFPEPKEVTLLMKQIRYFNKMFSMHQSNLYKSFSIDVGQLTSENGVWPDAGTHLRNGQIVQGLDVKHFLHSTQIKKRSVLYAMLLERHHPEISVHPLQIEQLLKWKYGLPLPTFMKNAKLTSLMDWFTIHEPYSFGEFSLFRELCIVGVFAEIPSVHTSIWNRENLFQVACSIFGVDWKKLIQYLDNVVSPFFTLFCYLYADKNCNISKDEERCFWKKSFSKMQSFFPISSWEDSTWLALEQVVQQLKDHLQDECVECVEGKNHSNKPRLPILYVVSKYPMRDFGRFGLLLTREFGWTSSEVLGYRYLPQGAPTSPILANIVMQDFDEEVYLWSKERGLLYSRYADDLTFSGNTMPQNLVQHINTLLERRYYRINRNKTSKRMFGQHQEVNGLVINDGYVRVSSKYMKWLRAELHFLRVSIQNNENGLEEPKLKAQHKSLYGHLQYVKGVHPGQFEKLWSIFISLSCTQSTPISPREGWDF